MADSESKFLRKLMKIFTKGFFGWLITNLTSDFQNLRWRIRYGGRRSVTFQEYSWKFLLLGFSGGWLRIWCQIFKIQDGGSNMADAKNEYPRILMNIFTKRFFWSLITNPTSYFQNTRWRIQHGGGRNVNLWKFWWKLFSTRFWSYWLQIQSFHNPKLTTRNWTISAYFMFPPRLKIFF